jgi:hypothetical protein
MTQEWLLQTKETRRTFSNATWVPLRASITDVRGEVRGIGHVSEFFGCGSVAFPPEHRETAERLGWMDIGLIHITQPYAYEDGYYASIEQYQRNDKEPIGIHLVFEHPQHVVGGRLWILNPDLVVALHLVKEGQNWVRPEENFVVVAREVFDEVGNHTLIEIKREFLLDYLAARNLSLRLSYYRQRVENVDDLDSSPYGGLEEHDHERYDGRFKLLIRSLHDVFGGSWALFRAWRTDVDEDDDAPVMGPENDENTEFEKREGHRSGLAGVRVEGEFWRNEWIDHQGRSVRIRGDAEQDLPLFIVETDGTRMASTDLNNEDIGRWLWFRSGVVKELLSHRGFSLQWYTAETGAICSTSGLKTHFGLNSSDLITVYAYDVARLLPWEQRVWAAHNAGPDGKVSAELLAAQVKAQPASTHAVEELLFKCMRMLEKGFREHFNINLFSHEINDEELIQTISRFESRDLPSLLKLAKDLNRAFSDRLDIRELRKLSTHEKREQLGSIKLLEEVLAQKVGAERSRDILGVVVGVYDMRVGDAHPTSSKISDAIRLARIDENNSFLRQGEQIISNYGQSIWWIGRLLFHPENEKSS